MLDFVFIKENIAHLLNLDRPILIKKYILHPKHSLESSLEALMLGTGVRVLTMEVVKSLKDLKACLNQKVFRQFSFLSLTSAIKIKQ